MLASLLEKSRTKVADIISLSFPFGSYFSDNNLDIMLRRNAVQLLLVPMLTLVPNGYVIAFFKRHIVEIMNTLQKPVLRRGTDEEVKLDLIERMGCFNLVQISFHARIC